MQLILGKKSEPINSILLVPSQLRFNGNGDLVLLNLRSIQELREESTFLLASNEQFFREIWGIGETSLGRINAYVHSSVVCETHLERNHLYQQCESVRSDEAE